MTSPKHRREVFMARRELRNAERLLRRAASALETVALLLDGALEVTEQRNDD